MRDKVINCIQCDSPFILTVEEQRKILDRGFTLPKRCPECRRKKAKMHEVDERKRSKKKKKDSHRRNDFDWDES